MPKEFFDLADHQLNAESEFKTHWGNFGYWQLAKNYPDACEALAMLVADAAGIDEKSQLLDCGFGAGEQLLTWINRYKVRSIIGVNLSLSQTDVAQNKVNHLKHCDTEVNLYQGNAVEFLIDKNGIDYKNSAIDKVSHIIALDCAYHFDKRELFFGQAFEALPLDGKIALSDLTFCTLPKTFAGKMRYRILSALIALAKIPKENVISVQQYQAMLSDAGFQEIELMDITADVIKGFSQWLPRYKSHTALPAKNKWMKYTITVLFLQWACRHRMIQYQLISAKK